MRTALLFAGQGAQIIGMGRDLAEKIPAARKAFDDANRILGYDLTKICFEGPEAELTKTEHAQPGIYAASWACLKVLEISNLDLEFAATAGLSLGEATALAAAGAMSFEEGLRLVRARGIYMQEACDATAGGMAAVIGLEEGKVAEVCKVSDIEVANLNCPGQIVVSGEKNKVAAATPKLEQAGARKVISLSVAGAYHSRLMTSAVPKLESELAKIAFQAPKQIVVSNVTAEPVKSAEEIRSLLARQVVSPVRWEASMQWLLANGFTRFIELGPGTALTGFMKRIDKAATVHNVADVASLDKTVEALSR